MSIAPNESYQSHRRRIISSRSESAVHNTALVSESSKNFHDLTRRSHVRGRYTSRCQSLSSRTHPLVHSTSTGHPKYDRTRIVTILTKHLQSQPFLELVKNVITEFVFLELVSEENQTGLRGNTRWMATCRALSWPSHTSP